MSVTSENFDVGPLRFCASHVNALYGGITEELAADCRFSDITFARVITFNGWTGRRK